MGSSVSVVVSKPIVKHGGGRFEESKNNIRVLAFFCAALKQFNSATTLRYFLQDDGGQKAFLNYLFKVLPLSDLNNVLMEIGSLMNCDADGDSQTFEPANRISDTASLTDLFEAFLSSPHLSSWMAAIRGNISGCIVSRDLSLSKDSRPRNAEPNTKLHTLRDHVTNLSLLTVSCGEKELSERGWKTDDIVDTARSRADTLTVMSDEHSGRLHNMRRSRSNSGAKGDPITVRVLGDLDESVYNKFIRSQSWLSTFLVGVECLNLAVSVCFVQDKLDNTLTRRGQSLIAKYPLAYVNPAMERLFGYSKLDCMGLNAGFMQLRPSQVIDGAGQSTYSAPKDSDMRTHGGLHLLEKWFQNCVDVNLCAQCFCKDATPTHVHIVARPISDQTGTCIAVVVFYFPVPSSIAMGPILRNNSRLALRLPAAVEVDNWI